MSLEDDTDNGEVELRELVTQTLEENGVLAKIKAQLRAGLYLALENDINTGNGGAGDTTTTYNDHLKTKLKNPDIRLIFNLVREFLDYFELNFTLSVFEKESLMSGEYKNREKLIQELDIGIDQLQNSPLLLEILNIARSSFNLSVRDININNKNTTYDLIHDKSVDSNLTTETFQHVINIKTVPKGPKDPKESKDNILNETIDINNIAQQESVVEGPQTTKNEMDDDTYEGTSSIAEDSSNIDFKIEDNNKSTSSTSSEKRKQDKTLKPMSALSSSLTDLPPLQLQLNKSRNSADTVLLPSLYTKREKSASKDFDKLFDASYDSLDNYEEDFLSSTSLDDANIFIPSRPVFNKQIKTQQDEKLLNKTNTENGSNKSNTTTTISEDFDINSNFDDILKSENST